MLRRAFDQILLLSYNKPSKKWNTIVTVVEGDAEVTASLNRFLFHLYCMIPLCSLQSFAIVRAGCVA